MGMIELGRQFMGFRVEDKVHHKEKQGHKMQILVGDWAPASSLKCS